MIKKNGLSISFISLLCGALTGQIPINDITKLSNEYCIYTESVWYNDTLYIGGTVTNFNQENSRLAVIAKYSKDAYYSDVVYIIDTSTTYKYGFWLKGFIISNDTIYKTGSKSFYEPDHVEGIIFKLNLDGSVIDSKSFRNYYYPAENINHFRDFQRISDGFIIADLSWRTYQDGQCCLIRIDNDFNLIWRKCYGNASKEIPSQVFQLSNGHFIVIANNTNLDITETYQGAGTGYYRGYIFETDGEGNLQWEWRSPSPIEAAYAASLENDSILIVASGLGMERCFSPHPLSTCLFDWTGGVYKFNLMTREKIWQTRISGGPYSSMFDNRYLDIIPSIEGDGYILCGAGYDLAYPGCAQVDTTVKCWSFPGVIAKVSNEGDSLWLRKYFGVTDIWESNLLYDAEITPDSGYSFVGEAFNPWPGETQGQYGWLLMTDRYGCLVPGCHLVSGTQDDEQETMSPSPAFKIHPNPATDMLNVLMTKDDLRSATLYLFDAQGKEVGQWTNFEKGGTYMIPVHHLPRGLFVLTLINNGFIAGTEMVTLQ